MSDVAVHNAVLEDAVLDVKGAADSHELQAVIADVPAVIKESKAGYKTTEFWMTVAGLLAVNLSGVVMTLPDKYQAIATAVLAGLYAASRGFAKKGIPAIEAPPEA